LLSMKRSASVSSPTTCSSSSEQQQQAAQHKSQYFEALASGAGTNADVCKRTAEQKGQPDIQTALPTVGVTPVLHKPAATSPCY
jgi:hypothetical protein